LSAADGSLSATDKPLNDDDDNSSAMTEEEQRRIQVSD